MVPNTESEVSPGKIDSHKSICEIIDCSVLFFHNVAYKYVVMVIKSYKIKSKLI